MILASAIVLAGVCSLLELTIVSKVPAIKRAVVKQPLAGVALSFTLSWAAGAVFGASGVIVMMAGMISTAATALMYSAGNAVSKVLGVFSRRRKENSQVQSSALPTPA